MPQEQEIKSRLTTLKKSISREQTELFSKILVGAILADEEIHPSEKVWLDCFEQEFMLDSESQKAMAGWLHAGEPLKVESDLVFDERIALQILEIVLLICACDLDLHMNEIYFINHCAHLLGITEEKTKSLIIQEGYRIHLETLDEFCDQLPKDLASKLDKDIKHMVNDHDLDQKVFDDVLQSLEFSFHEDSDKDNSITKKQAVEKILSFILEGTHENGYWTETTDLCLQTFALREGLSQAEFNWLKQNTKTNYHLLVQ